MGHFGEHHKCAFPPIQLKSSECGFPMWVRLSVWGHATYNSWSAPDFRGSSRLFLLSSWVEATLCGFMHGSISQVLAPGKHTIHPLVNGPAAYSIIVILLSSLTRRRTRSQQLTLKLFQKWISPHIYQTREKYCILQVIFWSSSHLAYHQRKETTNHLPQTLEGVGH